MTPRQARFDTGSRRRRANGAPSAKGCANAAFPLIAAAAIAFVCVQHVTHVLSDDDGRAPSGEIIPGRSISAPGHFLSW